MNHDKMGKFISDRRKEKGITQDEIASKLGITSQSVSKWERGINTPDISMLKDLSAILGVEVEELLRGERKGNDIEADNDSLKEKKKLCKDKKFKKNIIWGVILIILIFVIAGIYFILKDRNYDNTENFTQEFVDVQKNDEMVFEALSYVNFMMDHNKNIVEKLFDKNESIVTKDNLTDNENMFLTLSKHSKDNGGFIYYAFDYYFKEEKLNKLVFEDTSFVNHYKEEGKHYLINGNIDLIYERGLFNATGTPGEDFKRPNYVFDIISAKRNNEKLVIELKVGYVLMQKADDETDYEFYSYANVNDSNYVEKVDFDKMNFNDEMKFYNTTLGDEYTSYRYTLKIVEDKVYFESIEKI